MHDVVYIWTLGVWTDPPFHHSTRFFRVKWKHLGYAESTWEEESTLQSEEDKVV